MLSIYILLATLGFGLLDGIGAKSSTGDSVLVVLDPKLDKKDFSIFFGGLEGQLQHIQLRGS
jgi:oligosaccharyltransferase complex subunit beta